MSFPRFLKLVAQGDSDTVLEYLEEHADDDHLLQNINRPQPKLKHHTCLTYAVHVLADVGMVKNLLEGPLASTISAVAEDGQSTTPVDYAVLGGNRHMVELVLGVGNGVAGPRCKQYFEGEEGRLVGLFAAASAELPDEQAGGMVVLLGRLLLLPEADKPRINFAEGEGGRHVIYHTLAGENKAESLGVVLGRAEAQAWFGSAMVEDSLGVSPLRLAIEGMNFGISFSAEVVEGCCGSVQDFGDKAVHLGVLHIVAPLTAAPWLGMYSIVSFLSH